MSDNQDDVVFATMALNEPSQLLAIIFDVSSAWYTELVPHLPPQHRQYARRILSQLYFDTIGQICIFLNTFMALNKTNIIHFIAVNDDRSIVLQQQLTYAQQRSSMENNNESNDNNNNILFPNITWVDPDHLPRPTQANDELFGTTTSDIYAKLLLLNPFQIPPPSSQTTQTTQTPSTSNTSTNTTTTTTNTTNQTTIDPHVQIKEKKNNPDQNQNEKSFAKLFTGAFTKALCFINKAKKFNQSLSPHILLFSLSPFQASSGYMSCALYAARIRCLVDTLCLNHLFTQHDIQQEEYQADGKKLSNLLTPIISTTLTQQHHYKQSVLAKGEEFVPLNLQPLSGLKKPQMITGQSCHCEAHQQASHITNGCSLYISHGDMFTLVQLYADSYSPIGSQEKIINEKGAKNNEKDNDNNNNNNAMTDTTSPPPQSIDSILFQPQEYLYLLPLLQAHCLSSESIRQHLITPTQTSVTLTSPCFCHPNSSQSIQDKNQYSSTLSSTGSISHSTLQKTQPPRYLCNVCLVVVCKQFPQCPNCKSRFVTSKLAVPLKGTEQKKPKPKPQQQQQQQVNPATGVATISNQNNLPKPTVATATATGQAPIRVQIPTINRPGVAQPGKPAVGTKPGKINISLNKR